VILLILLVGIGVGLFVWKSRRDVAKLANCAGQSLPRKTQEELEFDALMEPYRRMAAVEEAAEGASAVVVFLTALRDKRELSRAVKMMVWKIIHQWQGGLFRRSPSRR